jgi:hypothetical protein
VVEKDESGEQSVLGKLSTTQLINYLLLFPTPLLLSDTTLWRLSERSKRRDR